MIIKRSRLSLLPLPAMMPFRVGRGFEGRMSSMSLSDPSSSGTSMSESSSFTAENIFCLNHKETSRSCDYCFAFTVCLIDCLTGTLHQIPLLLPQLVLHHPQGVFSLLQRKDTDKCIQYSQNEEVKFSQLHRISRDALV